MFLFFVLLFVLIVIYTTTQQEGFKSPNTINIPNTIPSTPVSNITETATVTPLTQPGQLPVASYEQTASMSPLPYQDTTLIKANYQQLISQLEMLKGFLAFEAQEISERSDPTIQLPLNTARSDFQILQNEVQVLNRNPGLQPTITLSHLNDIGSNLAYLQQKVRVQGSAGQIQGPINEFTTRKGVEGFVNAPSGQIASADDLASFIVRIKGEIMRLTASGTTDPIIQSRVTSLTGLQNSIQTIIDQVNSGALQSTEIPIMKADIDKALPILSDPTQPLPTIIKSLGLPAGWGNLLPSNVQNDPNTVRQINELINKYAEQVVNGLSVGAMFKVNYTSPADIEKAKAQSTVDKTGFPSITDLSNVSNQPNTFLSGNQVDALSMLPSSDSMASIPSDAGRGPSHFDWKKRAKDIEDQIRKRGFSQAEQRDFGVMKLTNVSDSFSWKGYAKMLCTRLQATYDPNLPEACGCPPMDWTGWRG